MGQSVANPKRKLLPLQQKKGLMKMTKTLFIFLSGACVVRWSHSYGKLLRCLLIVILFQMFAGDPDAAGAAVVCTGSFNLLTAIKLQSHSDKSVYLGGWGDAQLETSISSVFALRIEKCCHLN